MLELYLIAKLVRIIPENGFLNLCLSSYSAWCKANRSILLRHPLLSCKGPLCFFLCDNVGHLLSKVNKQELNPLRSCSKSWRVWRIIPFPELLNESTFCPGPWKEFPRPFGGSVLHLTLIFGKHPSSACCRSLLRLLMCEDQTLRQKTPLWSPFEYNWNPYNPTQVSKQLENCGPKDNPNLHYFIKNCWGEVC